MLARIRRIVAFFHRSNTATSVLKLKAEQQGLPALKLKIDVATRWNSAYDMVSRFYELQDAVVSTLRSKDLSKAKSREKDLNSLSDEDIELVEELIRCLKPMKHITTMLCSEGNPTVSMILPLLTDMLNRKLLPSNVPRADLTDAAKTIEDVKKSMRKDLEGRYTGKMETLKLASALDPRFKALPFLTDDERDEVYGNLAKQAAALPDPKPPTIKTETCATEQNPEEQEGRGIKRKHEESEERVKEQAKESDRGDLQGLLGDVYITHAEPAKSKFELVQHELANYRAQASVSLDSNPLAWWKNKCNMFPLLSRMAKAHLCIPATSVPSERVFSTAGDIITQSRACLKPKHVDMLLFLKKNA